MRVSANTFPDALISQLSSLTARQNRLQTQAATGQRIQSPEDDPAAMRRVLDLQAEASSLAQYQRNISSHQETAQAALASIKALKKISDRASEIATLADGLKSKDELASYGKELDQLIQEAVQVTNAKDRGNFIFGGTRTDQPPFVVQTDTNGQVTGVTYQGHTNVPSSEIAEGLTVTAQIPGANTTGSGPAGLVTDTRSGADFFNHLIDLQKHLAGGDTDAIAKSDRANLAKDEDNLLSHLSANGALQARLDASAAAASERSTRLDGSVSKEADADLAQTMVQLQQIQTAYQAALQSGSILLRQSLLDFLR